LNGIDGVIHCEVWDEFITRHGRDQVFPKRKFIRDDLDELSAADLAAAESVWGQFGHMSAWELRDYTHQNCPEYTETTGRIPISYREVLEALGQNDAEAEAVEREIADVRRSESALAD
jgi:hypothetical protein